MVLSFVGLLLIALNLRKNKLKLFFLAYYPVVAAAMASIAKDVFLPDLLGLLEHILGFSVAGVLFALVAQRSSRRIARLRAEMVKAMEKLKWS